MRYLIIFGLLAGCAVVPDGWGRNRPAPAGDAVIPAQAAQSSEAGVRPVARPASVSEPETAEAPAPESQSAASGSLGTTVASLGSPAEPGLWLKTPLVASQQAGRVSYKGKTIEVTLIPIEGPDTAGSRMSLPAFQALGAALTDLVEVSVSA